MGLRNQFTHGNYRCLTITQAKKRMILTCELNFINSSLILEEKVIYKKLVTISGESINIRKIIQCAILPI